MLQFIKNILPSQSPLLPDQVWAAIRTEHYRLRIEEAYIHWIKKYIFFYHKHHPAKKIITWLVNDEEIPSKPDKLELKIKNAINR